jgi:hypothetical protein
MPTKWIPSVKQTKKLLVYSDSSVSGQWATIVPQAIKEFNALAKRHSLGVTMASSKDKPTETGGANINIGVISGKILVKYNRQEFPDELDGRKMHGSTLLADGDNGLEKVFVHVPADPQIHTPNGTRAVGPKIKLLIMLHELIHGCGLYNSDHAREGVFQPSPSVDYGGTPAQDKAWYKPTDFTRAMPPFVLAADTIKAIQDLWK